jgi:hypothetical protein
MRDNWVALTNLVQRVTGVPTHIHKIIGNDLKPSEGWLLSENALEMFVSKSCAAT